MAGHRDTTETTARRAHLRRGAGLLLGLGAALGATQHASAQQLVTGPTGAGSSNGGGTTTGAVAIGDGASTVGPYSFAAGSGATAQQNTAFGFDMSTATNTAAPAQGAALNAGGIAIGSDSFAGTTGGGSTLAIGNRARALGTPSGDNIAIGADSYASGIDSLSIGGQTAATGQSSIAIGGNFTRALSANSVVLGVNSLATTAAGGSTVLGTNASASVANGVALGSGSVAGRAGLVNGTEAFSNSTLNSLGAVSVGNAGAGGLRQITNLAGGTQDTDAVNVRQLRGVGGTLATTLGGSFDPATNAYTAPTYSYAGSSFTTVPGAIAAIDSLGVRYNAGVGGAPANAIDLTRGGTIGGGAGVSITGLAPATTATGAVSLSQLPVQYATAGAPTTANPATPSNNVTLVGANGALPVTLSNVAAGTVAAGSTDAVNGDQLNTTNQAVAGLQNGTAGLVRQASNVAPVTVAAGSGGTTVSFLNDSNATRTLTGVSAGNVAAGSTDAVNGGQLFTLQNQLNSGSVGLVQQDATTRNLSVGGTTDGTSVSFANNASQNRQLSGVAAGQIAAGSAQAVNGGQIFSVSTSVAQGLGGGSTVAANGTVTAPSYAVAGANYNNVGGAIAALNNTGVRYDVDPTTQARTNSLTLAGGDPNQPVLLRNVAAGTAATDAATVGQVAQASTQSRAYTDQRYVAAQQYTDQRLAAMSQQMGDVGNELANLNREVGKAKQEARRAAAIGLAAGSLRYDDRPGKVSIAAGGGYWRGEGAASFGIGYTLPNGQGRINAAGVTTGRDIGFGAGASFTLN